DRLHPGRGRRALRVPLAPPSAAALVPRRAARARDAGGAGVSRVLVSIDPATGSPIGETPISSGPEIAATVSRAREAQPDWAGVPIEERAELLRRAAGLLDERRDEIARLVTREEGKVLSESVPEVEDAANRIRWFADEGPEHLRPRTARAARVRAL